MKPTTSARQARKVYGAIYRDEYISIFWDGLDRSQGTQEGDTQNARAVPDCMHKGEDTENQRPPWLVYRGRKTVVSVAFHLACSWLGYSMTSSARPSSVIG